MSLSGKITTISCRIDLGAIEPVSNSFDFQTIVPNGRMIYAAQRFDHLIWAITRSGLLMKTNAHLPFTARFMYIITKEEKKPVSHSMVSDSEV